jgi:hypothetical protein
MTPKRKLGGAISKVRLQLSSGERARRCPAPGTEGVVAAFTFG